MRDTAPPLLLRWDNGVPHSGKASTSSSRRLEQVRESDRGGLPAVPRSNGNRRGAPRPEAKPLAHGRRALGPLRVPIPWRSRLFHRHGAPTPARSRPDPTSRAPWTHFGVEGPPHVSSEGLATSPLSVPPPVRGVRACSGLVEDAQGVVRVVAHAVARVETPGLSSASPPVSDRSGGGETGGRPRPTCLDWRSGGRDVRDDHAVRACPRDPGARVRPYLPRLGPPQTDVEDPPQGPVFEGRRPERRPPPTTPALSPVEWETNPGIGGVRKGPSSVRKGSVFPRPLPVPGPPLPEQGANRQPRDPCPVTFLPRVASRRGPRSGTCDGAPTSGARRDRGASAGGSSTEACPGEIPPPVRVLSSPPEGSVGRPGSLSCDVSGRGILRTECGPSTLER